MTKFEIRWLCSCFEVRESPADALSTSSSIHQKKAVINISSKPGGLARQSKKSMSLWRFLNRITKIISSLVHLVNASGAPNPEHRHAPRAGTSKDQLMKPENAKTTFHSINLKPETSPSPGISSQKQLNMMVSVPPAFKRRHLNPRIRSSSVFAWTRGRRKMEDFVVMDGTFLGRGAFGSVRLCSNKSTGHLMACKTIDKVDRENMTKQQACMIRREVKMHQLCSDHPNVVQMLGLFEDDAAVHILMEYCDAGCLSEILQRSPWGFPVNAAAEGMKHLADALCWIHGKNIVHRDIKPENILVAAKGRSVTCLKVGDFGIAIQLKPGQGKYSVLMRPRSPCGSPGYMAPEVLRKDAYGTAVDIWSTGVVLCKMLTRKTPFDLHYDLQTVRKLDLSLPHWKHVPHQAKHLVSRMLEYDPQKRITAAQILEHPWIKEHNEL